MLLVEKEYKISAKENHTLHKSLCPQEQNDRLLVMYPSTLIILSEENDGLFYKVRLTPF